MFASRVARDIFVCVSNTIDMTWSMIFGLGASLTCCALETFCWDFASHVCWVVILAHYNNKRTLDSTTWILPPYCWPAFHSRGYRGAWSIQCICRCSSRACYMWFMSAWHQKHQAERSGCCGCSEAQHPQPFIVARTFINNTAGVLMRTVA